jgi:hypothetical protein
MNAAPPPTTMLTGLDANSSSIGLLAWAVATISTRDAPM